ncbi:MAG: hypothetical protein V1754_01830 [Pseudomonadota bacterium]
MTNCGTCSHACSNLNEGACDSGDCFKVNSFTSVNYKTTCNSQCALTGKVCAPLCNIKYTRPNGTVYQNIAGGHYLYHAAYQPYGWLDCDESPYQADPYSSLDGKADVKCCCSE